VNAKERAALRSSGVHSHFFDNPTGPSVRALDETSQREWNALEPGWTLNVLVFPGVGGASA